MAELSPPPGSGLRGIRLLAGAIATASLGVAAPSLAQEIRLTGPLASAGETIYAVTERDVMARTEAYGWIQLGGTPAPDKASGPFGALGAQITNTAFRTTGYLNTPSDLRWGPWGQASIDGVGGRAEGGLAAQLYFYRRRAHAPVDVRFGGGYGEDALGRTPHLVLTIAGGRRWIEGVSWPPLTDRHGEEIEVPQLVSGFRFFLSLRGTIEERPRYWVTGGIELELGVTLRAPRPSSLTPLF